MAQAAKNGRLKQAFDKHRIQTEGQFQRLQRVFSLLDQKAEGAPCEAIKGILAEGSEVMEEFAGGPALDAGLIAAAQAVEHYEIARYGALGSWAELIDLGGVETLLDEEKETDLLLTQLAEEAINIKSA
jgi:ferritin-like metal-binding protein YciE